MSSDRLAINWKLEEIPMASVYLANASFERHNRLDGSIYGAEHISGRDNARSLLLDLHRLLGILYAAEAVRVEFDAMVRYSTDMVREGVRRMLRVDRKRIRRESLAGCPPLPREDGDPDWTLRNSFDAMDDTGFWQAKFTPRFDGKLENGLISSDLKNGLPFSQSTAGEDSHLSTGIEEVGQYPSPGLLIEEGAKSRYAHAPVKDDSRI